MKIAIASDHAGYQFKNDLKKYLEEKELLYTDFGTFKMDSCDYPEFAYKACNAIIKDEFDRGILVCGTGIGMCITANKNKGIRAATIYDTDMARMSRLHNDSNVLCLGARILNTNDVLDIIDVWLNTSFEGGRHQRRVDLISKLTGL